MPENTVSGGDIPLDTQTTLKMLEDDPAKVYARLRKVSPIVRLQALGGRIVFTKAEDTTRVKTDAEHFWSTDTTSPMQRAFGGHTLMRKDGCPHLKERRAMEPALDPEHIKRWASVFANLTDRLLEDLASHKSVDLLPSFANLISAGYLKIVLGLDDAGKDQLFDWANALVRGAMNASFDLEVFATSDSANNEMDACFDRMIEQHLTTPDGSVLSTMINASDPLEISQIRTNMKICIGGAVIETRDALLSTIYGLLRHPDQLRHCKETGHWDRACQEGLRWVAPIQASPRIVKKALVMRGFLIPEGETVMAIQASANHDEEHWDGADRFDIHRSHLNHQTFGEGAHRCLGDHVYRLLVAKIVLPKLFERFPVLCLADPRSEKFEGFAFRGPTSIKVNLC
jgi:cytochrome P450|tara:strand:+ start:3558 stop:4754 length:1197 start_codon:yes stop_codon:yes gene_type:complete